MKFLNKNLKLCMYYSFVLSLFSANVGYGDDLKAFPLKAALTKRSLSFEKKNYFPFYIPENFPSDIRFRGIVGTFSTITRNKENKNKVSSETLFGIDYSTSKKCPVLGQTVNSYAEAVAQFPHRSLVSIIIKQAHVGKQTLIVGFELPVGLPLHLPQGGCFMLSLDGSDFSGQEYTMSSDLNILYDTKKADYTSFTTAGLDSELIVAPTDRYGPVLNAYTVIPISGKGLIKPGKILDIYGVISATPPPSFGFLENKNEKWSLRQIIAVYRNGSCERAFPNHPDGKFTWNDHTEGYGKKNETSALWATSDILLNTTMTDYGLNSVQKQINLVRNLPATVVSGDCLVSAIIPGSSDSQIIGAMNTESQISVVSTP
ncbi:hypothetical protein [Acetobacter senegalensis]|uniref:hypothetical protein n=1 Tax=Acetobacter senegalensis TaxID=446692 RepID=UPI00128B1CE3|nr:hypothetical protein [Acetobacter senegalensis]MCG4257202.1 hypothetical protein [Acetobacter senegalensis]MCG4267088.1 hypothetical protein [Acetobacter senegalensis]MPQ74423.1 hypothetical protein [Acetobacter senegalensis]